MALNIQFGDDNEYIGNAERARANAGRDGKKAAGLFAGASPIAVVLDLLGVGRQVAKGPKEVENPAPNPVVDAVEAAVSQQPEKKLPLAPAEVAPLSPLSGQGLPRKIGPTLDPNTFLVR